MNEDIVTIETYDGPAVARTGATHLIRVESDEGDLMSLRPGTVFRHGDGPYLDIVMVLVDREHVGPGYGRVGASRFENRISYLAREVAI